MTGPMERDGILFDDAEVYPADLDEVESHDTIDEGRANWHLRKAMVLRAEADRIGEMFDEEIARLEYRRNTAMEGLSKHADWHESCLRAWHAHERKAGRVGAKVVLPAGESKFTAGGVSIEVRDEDALRAHIESLGADEDGVAYASKVWEPQGPKFKISQVPRGKVSSVGETAREIDVPTPDGEGTIPGLVGVVKPDTWKAG